MKFRMNKVISMLLVLSMMVTLLVPSIAVAAPENDGAIVFMTSKMTDGRIDDAPEFAPLTNVKLVGLQGQGEFPLTRVGADDPEGFMETQFYVLGLEYEPGTKINNYKLVIEPPAGYVVDESALAPSNTITVVTAAETEILVNTDLEKNFRVAFKKAADPVIEEKEETVVEAIQFQTETVKDDSIPTGETKVIQEGKDGEKTTIYTVTYTDGKETGRVVKDVKEVAPVNKIVATGTQVTETKQEEREEAIPFVTVREPDPKMLENTEVIVTEGVNGLEKSNTMSLT